jgi:hypothetical protein
MRVFTDWLSIMAVDNGCTRGGIAAGMQACHLAQLRMNPCPGPIQAKLAEIVIHRAPRAVLPGQIPPRAAGAQHVEDAIDDALDRHVSTCRACADVRTEYQRIDALILGLPAPVPLPDLPPQLLHEWGQEDARNMTLPLASTHTRSTQTLTEEHVALNGHVRSERLLPVHPTSTSPHARFSSRHRRFASGLGAAVAAMLVLAFTLVFLAQSRGSLSPANGHLNGPTPAAATRWQAAYLASDGHLHTVTLDGAHDTTGPLLPTTGFIQQTDAGWVDAAAAPDGHAIA